MRRISKEVMLGALVANVLLLPAGGAAQAPGEPAGCFAQPRIRADTAAPRGARGAARDTTLSAARRGAPDVILLASVSARELRFQSQPRVSVRLCGGFDSVRIVERRNLPERIVPGVTYRDVHIAVEILGHIYADCLREALAGGRSTLCPTAADSAPPPPRRPR
jgi:hypothetical protein